MTFHSSVFRFPVSGLPVFYISHSRPECPCPTAAVDPGRGVIEPAVTFFGETAMEKYFDLHGADFTIRCKIYFAPVAKPAAGIETGLEEAGQPFRHVIVFCHGFAGHKDSAMAQKLAGRILEKHDDTALVIFNWPGHGDPSAVSVCAVPQ